MIMRLPAWALFAAVGLPALGASGAITPPILEYRLNSADSSTTLPAGATVPNTGTVGSQGNLTMFGPGAPGTSSNLYSADGLGVSGLSGDRAMDNTGADGMGNLATYQASSIRGPGATNDAVHGILAGKTQLTITGWIRTTPGQMWDGLAQVWNGDAGNFMHIRGLGGQLVFQFGTVNSNNMQIGSGAANTHWNLIDQWMFVGITWDSTNSGRLEYFYVDENDLVQSGALFATTNATQGILASSNVSGGVNYGLSIGNQGGLRLRPFDGLLDNWRVFDTALTQADLQTIVNKDLLNQPLSTPGDFDGDGDVDGADFVAWQTNFPAASGATQEQGDADGDGDVDGADFAAWQDGFPSSTGGVTPVPEPSTIVLLFALGVATMGLRGRLAGRAGGFR